MMACFLNGQLTATRISPRTARRAELITASRYQLTGKRRLPGSVGCTGLGPVSGGRIAKTQRVAPRFSDPVHEKNVSRPLGRLVVLPKQSHPQIKSQLPHALNDAV